MRSALITWVLAAIVGCEGPTPAEDAGAEPVDLVLSAEPDPAERRDCASEAPAAGEARAKHVTCAEELTAGALAMGRLGDVVIENARARFVIRTGEEGATTIGGPAGGVVDAAHPGGVDLVKEILPALGLWSTRPTAIAVVDAGGDEEARVRVLFDAAPIALFDTVAPGLARPVPARGQLDYVLRGDERALRLEISLTTALGASSASAQGGLLALLGGQEMVQSGYGVLESDTLGGQGSILIGERDEGALAIALDAPGASLLRVETIHLLQGPRVVVRQGETTRYDARVAVGATATEAYAAVADGSLAPLAIEGAPGDRVELASAGAVLLRTRLGATGRAEVPLEAGTYALRAGFGPFFEADATSVDHGLAPTTHALEPAPAATLAIDAAVEGDTGAPVRVTVERDGEELLRFVAIGPTERRLPPGPARVTVSHGLEHDASQADVTLEDGAVTALAPILDRAIDTAGWVSVDLRLHTELSTDSTHRAEDALRMIAAEGVEAAASTDHDFITDYPALAASVGIEGRVVLVPGEEVSTTDFGHINGYPLMRDPDRAGAGAVSWPGLSPAAIFDGLRERGDEALGGALVQINHPRLGGSGFFDAIALDPETGRATADPASLDLPADTDLDDLDFEIIEVWNGYTRGDNERAFEDYLALYAAGRRFTMVGNSDTHRPSLPAGSPRSFVRVADDARGAFGWEAIASALRAGEVTVAAGVLVTASLAGPRAGGTVPVRVRAEAPPWAVTDRLRVYAGRAVVLDRPLVSSSEAVRVDEVISVPLGDASFIVVRVDGASASRPMQHFAPFGVTNPIAVP